MRPTGVDLAATPGELLDAARALLAADHAVAEGVWPRSAALLARQALEAAVADLWQQRGIDMGTVSTHAQLLCLGEYLGDQALGADARFAWWALSRACHHHPFELAATASELHS